MIAFGIFMLIGGIISAIYGVYLNNDVSSQLESFFSSGNTNPGDIFLYIGIIVAVLGVVFIFIGSVKNSNRQRPQYPPYGMPPQYPTYGVPVQPQAPVQAAFCSNCGTKLDTDAKFCPGCGSQVK